MKMQMFDLSRKFWRILSALLLLTLVLSPLGPAEAGPVSQPVNIDNLEIGGQGEDGSSAPVLQQTSAFLAGKVAVGLVAIESNGQEGTLNQEYWEPEELETVRNEVWAGLQKWVAWKPSGLLLDFVVDIDRDGVADDMTSDVIVPVEIAYEPIAESSGLYSLWGRMALEAMGYTGATTEDAAYAYASDLRSNHDADWAFVLFVIDSSDDNDGTLGAFLEGDYMRGRTFGPVAVMTYNNGTRGPGNMQWATAQLVARMFGAGFQYPDPLFELAGCPNTTQKFGYLGIPNTYCGIGVPSGEPNPRLMYHGMGDPDSTTKLQVGWRDTDGDGLIDPMDTRPSIVFSPYPFNPTSDNPLTYTDGGTRQYRAYENPFYPTVCLNRPADQCFHSYYHDVTPDNPAVTINEIQTVEYRIDGGAWNAASITGPADYKTYSFTTPTLAGGKRKIEVRTQNSAGVYSLPMSEVVAIADPATNDLFANRILIPSLSYNHAVDTYSIPLELEDDPTDPLPDSASCQNLRKGKRSVWYAFEASTNQTIFIGTLGTNYTTVVSVWVDKNQNGSIQNDELIACRDGILGQQPVVSFPAEAGTMYYFMISEFNNVVGSSNAQYDVSGQGGGTLIFYANILPASFGKTSPSNSVTAQSKSPIISWEDSNGAISYEYCYSSAPGPCAQWQSVGDRTYASLAGLAPGYTYYWQVRAVNLAGNTQADNGAWWSFMTESTPNCTWPGYTLPTSPSFLDVPMTAGHWAWVERLSNSGITAGCGNGNYCPFNNVIRAQMAIFLLRGKHCGSGYIPPAVGGSTGFNDVPLSATYAPWVKQLASEGITAGCGNGNFCPMVAVNRAQMAIFLLRAKHGSTYSPPAVGGSTGFGDVPLTASYAPWVKQLAAEGITIGCGGGNFCPLQNVNRAQMATFLVRVFGLP